MNVYIVNGDIIDFDFDTELRNKNYDIIKEEAKKEGRVYSLKDFQNAFNNCIKCDADIDYILIH